MHVCVCVRAIQIVVLKHLLNDSSEGLFHTSHHLSFFIIRHAANIKR